MPIQLHFKVRCETLLSEQVCICGNIQELGFWNPLQSFQLQTNNELYPLWAGSVILEAEESILNNILDSLVEFKAIKKGENVIWEDLDDNRVIQLRYQEQTILFSFNFSFIRLIRISSFESDDEIQDESIVFNFWQVFQIKQIKRIHIQSLITMIIQKTMKNTMFFSYSTHKKSNVFTFTMMKRWQSLINDQITSEMMYIKQKYKITQKFLIPLFSYTINSFQKSKGFSNVLGMISCVASYDKVLLSREIFFLHKLVSKLNNNLLLFMQNQSQISQKTLYFLSLELANLEQHLQVLHFTNKEYHQTIIELVRLYQQIKREHDQEFSIFNEYRKYTDNLLKAEKDYNEKLVMKLIQELQIPEKILPEGLEPVIFVEIQRKWGEFYISAHQLEQKLGIIISSKHQNDLNFLYSQSDSKSLRTTQLEELIIDFYNVKNKARIVKQYIESLINNQNQKVKQMLSQIKQNNSYYSSIKGNRFIDRIYDKHTGRGC